MSRYFIYKLPPPQSVKSQLHLEAINVYSASFSFERAACWRPGVSDLGRDRSRFPFKSSLDVPPALQLEKRIFCVFGRFSKLLSGGLMTCSSCISPLHYLPGVIVQHGSARRAVAL